MKTVSEELYTRTMICLFKPQAERLIDRLCRHSQMEPDTVGILGDGYVFTEYVQEGSNTILRYIV